MHNSTAQVVALKIIELDTTDDDITEIQREVALLSQLRAAEKNNITSYYGCFLHKTELWIAMELASGGSIRTLVSLFSNTLYLAVSCVSACVGKGLGIVVT